MTGRFCLRGLSLCLTIAMIVTGTARATVVVPVSFDELVGRADHIFRGRAIDRRTHWEDTTGGRVIMTVVTFQVERVLKGRIASPFELSFLGGTIGDLSLQVPDLPQFTVGDRDILFVSAEQHAASPLVGFNQGRFRVTTDPITRTEFVVRYDGRPVPRDVANSGRTGPQNGTPTSLAEFEAAIVERISASSAGGR